MDRSTRRSRRRSGRTSPRFCWDLPSSGQFDLNSHASAKSRYYAFFLQDDWRPRPDLTINLGLRWEHETPSVERYNRAVDGFDPTAVNPVSAAAAAAYAANPQPILPASQFKALGGLTFASAANREIYAGEFAHLQPALRNRVDSQGAEQQVRDPRRLRSVRLAAGDHRVESAGLQPDYPVPGHQQ